MSEGKIKEIKEVHDLQADCGINPGTGTYRGFMGNLNRIFGVTCFDGYQITTSEHTYFVLISNEQNCCEHWGYLTSEDDFKEFIGQELASVDLTNTALQTVEVRLKQDDVYQEYAQIQFVNFRIETGAVLQFAVYNEHNGFYGHDVIIAKDEEVLLNSCL